MDINITNKNGIILNTRNKVCEDDININIDNSQEILPENIAKDVTILGVTGEVTNAIDLIEGTITKYESPKNKFFKNNAMGDGTFGNCRKLTEIIFYKVDYLGMLFRNYTGKHPIQKISILEANDNRANTTPGNSRTFTNASELTDLYLCKNFTFNPYGYHYDFTDNTKLKNVIVEKGFHSNLDIHCSTEFTREILLNIINNYADLSNETSVSLVIGETNLAKLTEDRKSTRLNSSHTS